jgi:micrococcal nuclease
MRGRYPGGVRAPVIYEYKATLDRVVDGDTVWLNVDLGFRACIRVDFRLYGINTPELVGATRTAGLAAKTALEQLLALGPITVTTHKPEPTDKYGRWLATIYVESPEGRVDVNYALISEGHAVRYPS